MIIKAICVGGQSIPLFIILFSKLHQAAWYINLPNSQVLAVSNNSQIIDNLGFTQLEHFNWHTESRTIGRWWLLILDGYSSHATPQFQEYYKVYRIISLYMPAHTSYLLQPLDVSYFSPLKATYRREVAELARQGVFYIDKEEFLSIYPRIYRIVFIEQSIQSGFQAVGLILHYPERVLSCLTVVRILLLLGTAAGAEAAWIPEIPHTTTQAEQQAQLIYNCLQ